MLTRQQLERSGIITITSRDAPRSMFAGIAYTDAAVIIGPQQFAEHGAHLADEIEDGRFCIVYERDGVLVARTDKTGQDCIFFYRDGPRWAFSNSFLALAEALSEMGVTLTPNPGPIAAGHVSHSSTHQLLSCETLANEVRVLPIGAELIASPSGLEITYRVTNLGHTSYEGALLAFCETWPRRIAAILKHYGDQSRFDISGGVDSRTVLSLLLNADVDLSRLNFTSNVRWEKDYAVAGALAERFGFTIRNASPEASLCAPETAYDLWRYGNLGVYQPVYWPIGDSPADVAHVMGGGGECVRQFYKGDALQYANWLRDAAGEDAQRTFLRGVLDAGADILSPRSMREFYRHSRSRYHFGRSWYKSLNAALITPLASHDLIQAANFLTEEEVARNQILCDVVLLSCPGLVEIPFDDPKKAFSRDAIEQSRVKGLRARPSATEVRVHAAHHGSNGLRSRSNASMEALLLRDLEDIAHIDGVPDAIEQIRKPIKGITLDAVGATHLLSVATCFQT